MIATLAGRRVDAPDASQPRFPPENIDKVKEQLKAFFSENKIDWLVCSGACGADLIALEEAGRCHIRRKMVLPFNANIFRASSVVDRPGDWGEKFAAIYDRLKKESGVVILPYDADDDNVYVKTNYDILNIADELLQETGKVSEEKKVAIIIWEGTPKNSDDTTDHFRMEAIERGYIIKEINCLY